MSMPRRLFLLPLLQHSLAGGNPGIRQVASGLNESALD